ncbi:MAG: hypothetical protein JWM47_1846 [Acidimicrobiales bacterium]|nr:hypothetical protein [Acidimicrobiales bacterium]
MSANPFPQDRFVAIYPSRTHADEAAADLQSAGVDPALVRVGDREDLAAAMVGEMRQETGNSWRLLPSGIITAEQTKGSAMIMVIGGLVGVLVGLLIGLLPFGGLGLGSRLLICAIAGGLAGSTFGMVVGGGLGARGPATPGAAQGIAVSVARTDDRVRRVLAGHDALRLDRVAAGGNPIEPVQVDRGGPDSEPELLRDHLRQPTGGNWKSVDPAQPRTDET